MNIRSVSDAIYDTEILMTKSLLSYSSDSSANMELFPLKKDTQEDLIKL